MHQFECRRHSDAVCGCLSCLVLLVLAVEEPLECRLGVVVMHPQSVACRPLQQCAILQTDRQIVRCD